MPRSDRATDDSRRSRRRFTGANAVTRPSHDAARLARRRRLERIIATLAHAPRTARPVLRMPRGCPLWGGVG